MIRYRSNKVVYSGRRTLTVIHGANAVELPYLNCSVAELRDGLRDVLNVGFEARPYVGGRLVGDDHVPSVRSCIEYVKNRGTKGSGRRHIEVVEIGPEIVAVLERLAQAIEQIAGNFNSPSNDHTAGGFESTDGKVKGQVSPYLTAEEAARYLGISIKSLYGAVERRHLVPLRGPRRTYRFTVEMLDEYLKR
jgi:excisionase family DNA binding protein